MRLISFLLPAALLLSALAGGCASENLEDLTNAPIVVPCDTTAVATYSGVIQPILNRYNCNSCHRAGGVGVVAGSYNYETPAGLQKAVQDGRLIGAIEHQPNFQAMPRPVGEKIAACDIARIKQWMRRGAPAD